MRVNSEDIPEKGNVRGLALADTTFHYKTRTIKMLLQWQWLTND